MVERHGMRELAEKLLSIEDAGHSDEHAPAQKAGMVSERLRVHLTRFAGADGFTALIRRALTLSRADVPELQAATVKPDGSIEGLDAASKAATDGGREASIVLTTNLLNLLVTFVGEPLTRRLVNDAWPDENLDI
jgi:hypothetical protein